MTKKHLSRSFINSGMVFTLLACISYPLIYFLEPQGEIGLILIILFAVSIDLSTAGIYHFLAHHRKNNWLQTGLGLVITASVLYVIAGTLGIALSLPLEGILVQGDQSFIYALTGRIVVGMDFLWNILFGMGIVCLAIPAFFHPKTGKVIPVLGILIGLMNIIINLYSFPESPDNLNLTGSGATAPVWHFLLYLIIFFSPSWIRENTELES